MRKAKALALIPAAEDTRTNKSSSSESESESEPEKTENAEDPLINMLNDSQVDEAVSNARFTQPPNFESQDSQSHSPKICPISPNLKSPKKQTTIFSFAKSLDERLTDKNPYYQTVLDIYCFFNRKKSIPQILQSIHRNAGDIPRTVKSLAKKKQNSDNDTNDFNYKSIHASPDDIEYYLQGST